MADEMQTESPALIAPATRSDAGQLETAMATALWRGLPQLLMVMGRDGRMRAVNPAWLQLLGRDPQQLPGRPFLDLVHVEDLTSAQRWLGGLGGGRSACGGAAASNLRLQA